MNFVDNSAENNERKLLNKKYSSSQKLTPFDYDSSTAKKSKNTFDNVSNNTYSYETEREKEKMSFFQTTVLQIKATVGLMFLILPFFYSKCGLILGPICIMISSFCCMYGTYVLLQITEDIENKKNIEIDTIDEVGQYCIEDWRRYLYQWLLRIPVMMFAFCIVMGDIVQFGNYMNQLFQWKIETGKILSIIFVAALVIYLNIPEKLKYVGLVSFYLAILLLISVCYDQSTEILDDIEGVASSKQLTYNYMAWTQMGGIIAPCISALGNNTIIFVVRRTAKKETVKSLKSQYCTIVFVVGVIFCIYCTIIYLHQGNEGIQPMVTDYYKLDTYFVTVNIAYLVSIVVYCLVIFIAGCEIIENINIIKTFISKDNGKVNVFNRTVLRQIILGVLSIIIMSPIDIPKISDFAGSLFMIPIQMLLPFLLKYSYYSKIDLKTKQIDGFQVQLGLSFSFMGMYNFFEG